MDEYEHEATAEEWELVDVGEAGIDSSLPSSPVDEDEESARRLMLESGIDVRPFLEREDA
jgi:hypothetical protein